MLDTNGEDHHKNIAKTLIQTASKLNDAAKMHVTKKVLPVGISKVDDEKLLEEIRSREEKGMWKHHLIQEYEHTHTHIHTCNNFE